MSVTYTRITGANLLAKLVEHSTVSGNVPQRRVLVRDCPIWEHRPYLRCLAAAKHRNVAIIINVTHHVTLVALPSHQENRHIAVSPACGSKERVHKTTATGGHNDAPQGNHRLGIVPQVDWRAPSRIHHRLCGLEQFLGHP